MNAIAVEKSSETAHSSDNMREFMQEKNPTNVTNAAKPLVEALSLPCTQSYIVERNPMHPSM